MDTDPSKTTPEDIDSRETDGVAARHAAAAREKSEPTFGTSSISLWTFLICAAVLLFGGNFMGKLSGGFRFDQYVVPGYVPQPPPGQEGVVEEAPWIDSYMALGKKRYNACAACHGPDGNGNASMGYPPLAGSEWVVKNTEKLGLIILAGLQGPITVKGKNYSNVMPSQAAGLDAEALGAVMTYVRRSFGNDASIVTPEMAQVALDLHKARQAAGKAAVTAAELLAEHDKMLPGAEVDPQTGKPAGAADASAGEAAPAAETPAPVN